MTSAPLIFRWGEVFDENGEVAPAMVPLSRFRRMAEERFDLGQNYRLIPDEERSMRSHNHYFASLHEYWLNLPEELALAFPSQEHLRKHALIKIGYYNEVRHIAESEKAAERYARFLKKTVLGGRSAEDYAVVSVAGEVVIWRTAKSQSKREMGNKEFQTSKEMVLAYCAQLVGARVKEPEHA